MVHFVDAGAQVAANMRHPASGVPVKKRKRRLQVFTDAFVGTDAVDWLVRNYSLPRRAAVELGQKLMLLHYFHHVSVAMHRHAKLYGFLLLLT